MSHMRKTRIFTIIAMAAAILIHFPCMLRAQGRFEFGFHYGHWSLNLIKPIIEGMVDDFAAQIKDNVLDKIQEDHPMLREIGFRNDFTFDSGGPNFGFEFRWYPAGHNGSFSVGVCVERTTLRIGLPSVSTSIDLEDTNTHMNASAGASASATVESKPLAFLLNFRWDILATKVVHPYFTFGFGIAGESAILKTRLIYDFHGTLIDPYGAEETIEESGDKTVQQLMDEDRQRKLDEGSTEEPFELPLHFIPFLQLHFGLKGVITKNVHALIDFGILDGFLLRGGIAIRI